MGKTKYLSAFELDMVVGAKRTGLCQELQRCWVFTHEAYPRSIVTHRAIKAMALAAQGALLLQVSERVTSHD